MRHPLSPASTKPRGARARLIPGRAPAWARAGAGLAAVVSLLVAAGCDGPPSDQRMQWVARDAWDHTCAEKAMVEQWKVSNGHWKIKGEVWVADVDAVFRLTDDCASGLPLIGKKYKTLEKAPFKGTVEMSRCKKDGETGWSLPGKEGSRCWTGPTLLASGGGVDVHVHVGDNKLHVDVNGPGGSNGSDGSNGSK